MNTPTALAVESSQHARDLLRELRRVAAAGREDEAGLSRQILHTAEQVLTDYADVRRSFDRQARAAESIGFTTFTLTLDLPVEALAAVRTLFVALIEADRCSASGAVGTPAMSHELLTFRTHLYEEIVRQLGAASREGWGVRPSRFI